MQGVKGLYSIYSYISFRPVKSSATKTIKGVKYCQIKNMKISRKIRLYFEKKPCNLWVCLGKSPNRIFEPSSGGIGIKLNIAKTMLIRTTITESSTKD